PDGKYLLGVALSGVAQGIYQISITDRKLTLLLPDISTFVARFAPDSKSFLYPVPAQGEIDFYRQNWSDGKLIGKPQIAFKLPAAFPLNFFGNAYDFSPDLSTVIYSRPAGQSDFFLLGD